MNPVEDEAVGYEFFKSNMAQALAVISRYFEFMQANLLIIRSISRLLEEHNLVSTPEIRDHADQLALAVKSSSSTIAYVEQLLLRDDAKIRTILQ